MKYLLQSIIALLLVQHASTAAENTLEEANQLFFRTPLFSQCRLSPDGSHISMIGHRDKYNAIITYDVESGKMYGIKGNGGQDITSYGWIDGDYLVYNVVLWNLYNIGNFVVDERLRRARLIGRSQVDTSLGITFCEEALQLATGLIAVPDRAIFLDFTKDNHFPDLRYFDARSNTLRGRAKNEDRTVGWSCDSSGVVRIEERLTRPGKTKFMHRWNADEAYKPLPIDGPSWVLGFDASDKRIFVVSQGKTGRHEFKVFDLEKNAFIGKAVSHKEFSCYPSILSDNVSGAVVGAVYDWDKPKVIYFDPGYRQIHTALSKLFEGEVLTILGSTSKGQILFQVSSDTQPLRVLRIDPQAEQKLALLMHKADWIKPEHCRPMEPIQFKSRDGDLIHGYLTRSRVNSDKPCPTVMLVHGGPFRRDSWGFNPETQFLSYLGYNVIQVNFRGSRGFNSGYSITRLSKVCRYAINDIADGARWAIREGIADPDRIAIVGGSFGGYAALAGAAFEPELYKVAIGASGVYNYDKQLQDDYRGESELKEWFTPMLGDLNNESDLYHDLSPVNFADRITAEVLLLHGGADTRVYASQTRQMSKALRAAGKEHEVHINTWGVHGIYDQKESFEYGRLIGEFLLNNL